MKYYSGSKVALIERLAKTVFSLAIYSLKTLCRNTGCFAV
nr:MAG TPA: hypothetical protein [Caudoviricetes sp.]